MAMAAWDACLGIPGQKRAQCECVEHIFIAQSSVPLSLSVNSGNANFFIKKKYG